MNEELKNIIVDIISELDGAGLVITDWADIFDELDSLSNFIEDNLQVINQ